MQTQGQVQARQEQAVSTADEELQELYDQLADAADTAYDEIADDVERFFSAVIDQGSGILEHGRIDIEIDDGSPAARYRGRIGGEGRHSSHHRYLPLSDWDDYVQDVYAPLAAAAAGLRQVQEQDDIAAQDRRVLAAIDAYVEPADPEAANAQAVYDAVVPHMDIDDGATVASRFVYPTSYSGDEI